MYVATDLPASAQPTPTTVDALLGAAEALLAASPGRAAGTGEEALMLATDLGYPSGVAGAQLLLGRARHRLGELHRAEQHLQEALALYATLGEQAAQASALLAWGMVLRDLGALDRVGGVLDEALELSTAVGDAALNASILNHQAALSNSAGRPDQALQQLGAALQIRQALGDPLGAAQCLNNIGHVNLARHDLTAALASLTQAYDLLKSVNDPATSAHCLVNIGHVYEELGDHQQNYEYNERALKVARDHGLHNLEAYCLNNVSEALLNLNRPDDVRARFAEALHVSETLGMRYLTGCAHHGLGRAALLQDNTEQALEHFQQALEIACELGDQNSELDARLGLGEVQVLRGRHGEARGFLEQALTLATDLGSVKQTARIHELLARVEQSGGAHEAAAGHLWTLRILEQELFTQERDRRTMQLTVQFDVERAHHEAAVSHLQTAIAQQAHLDAEAKVATQTRRLALTQVEVVTRLALAAEYRDDVTGQHTLRVGHVAALLARQLHYAADDVAILRVAARLHDVGKIGISDLILQKPGKLTADEFAQMQGHTTIGAGILSGGESPLLQMAEQIALSHHERWDGGGYPAGLRGEAIPAMARIVAVADVYDALSHPRPYKAAWTLPDVLTEIQAQRGRHFQPEIVDALLALHATGLLPLTGPVEVDDQLPDLLIHRESMTAAERQASPTGTTVDSTAAAVRLADIEHKYALALEANTTLQMAVHTDPLTALGNRRAFDRDLEAAFCQAKQGRQSFSVVMVDVDNLKQINDLHGHLQGDALLQQVATALITHLGETARGYRIGGDEFTVIAPALYLHDQDSFLLELEDAVALASQQTGVAVRVSAGVASFPQDADHSPGLLHLSDQRMYARKRARRTPAVATPERHPVA